MHISNVTREKTEELKGRYPNRLSALIPALYLLQAEQGYLSQDGMEDIAEVLETTPADVLAVASFYTMLYKEPVGRKVVDVCTNLACMVNGADTVLAVLEERLSTPVNETTADGRCTLRHAECLGYCDRAPMMQIDYRPFGPLTRETIEEILSEEHLLPDSGTVEDGVASSGLDLSGTRIYGQLVKRP